MSDFFTNVWGYVLPLGILLFAGVIAWALLRNRRTPREEARTEQATEDLYDRGPTDDRVDR